IIGFNAFTGQSAAAFSASVDGMPSPFPLTQLEIFETYPFQGMPWNDRSTQTVDVTSILKQKLTSPSEIVILTLRMSGAPCNLAALKFISASLRLTIGQD